MEDTPWLDAPQQRALAGMDIREVLARNLKRYRRERELSQEALAHQAGVDRSYVSHLEREVYTAGIDVVDRLARALGVRAADLLMPPPVIQRRRLPEHVERRRLPEHRRGRPQR